MTFNIIYSSSIPFHTIKRRSQAFFEHTPYHHGKNVFSHLEASNTFYIQNNSIYIVSEEKDPQSLNMVESYLSSIFGSNLIGLRVSDPEYYKSLKTINYYKI